jgi:hypothetical protein
MLDRFMELFEEIKIVGGNLYVDAINKHIPSSKAHHDEMMAVIAIYRDLLQPFKEMTAAS